jgi:NAD(P)H dehydrogenase (quinone)
VIVVTAATGQVGREVVRLLAGAGPVRALVRDAAPAAGLEGVEPAVATFEDAEAMAAAMAGAEMVFLAGRDSPDYASQQCRAVDIAARAGARHVVKLSALGAAPGSPVELMRDHDAVEERLRSSGMAWTFLRPHLYMQNLLRFAGPVAGEGRLAAPMGDGAYPFVDARDVAAAAAAVLRAPAAHAGRAYALTGPRAVGYAEIARLMAAIAGRDVRYEAFAPGRFRADLEAAGIPAWRAADLAAIASAYTDADNRPTDAVAELAGRPPAPIERFLEDHRAALAAGASRSHA